MELLIILIITGVCSGAALLFSIRICPFYRLFKIPCPGCGLTRSILAFLRLDITQSIRYHILGIPLVVVVFIYLAFLIYTKATHKKLTILPPKAKPFIIGVAILILVISWINNLNNPLLY